MDVDRLICTETRCLTRRYQGGARQDRMTNDVDANNHVPLMY